MADAKTTRQRAGAPQRDHGHRQAEIAGSAAAEELVPAGERLDYGLIYQKAEEAQSAELSRRIVCLYAAWPVINDPSTPEIAVFPQCSAKVEPGAPGWKWNTGEIHRI